VFTEVDYYMSTFLWNEYISSYPLFLVATFAQLFTLKLMETVPYSRFYEVFLIPDTKHKTVFVQDWLRRSSVSHITRNETFNCSQTDLLLGA